MLHNRATTAVRVDPRDRIIVALDVGSAVEARRIVDELRGQVGAFKIGLQLFTAAGPEYVRELCSAGQKVFLDLKFHDIPTTVARAGVETARLGVWMFNVHASGGGEMMRRAAGDVREACEREAIPRPAVIGVTVLTSSADDGLREIGIEHDVSTQVSRLAMLAMENGLDGVVASALEAPAIRHAAGKRDFLIVSPGVRLKDASNDDQRRVTTPGAAVASGSDFVVIGRPITGAADMLKAVEQITADIAATS